VENVAYPPGSLGAAYKYIFLMLMTDTRSKRWKSAARVVGDFVTGDGGEQQSDFNFVRGCKNIQEMHFTIHHAGRVRLYKFISLILRLQHHQRDGENAFLPLSRACT
jgi:hypothetical protein